MKDRKLWVYNVLNEPAKCGRVGRALSTWLFLLIILNAALIFVIYDDRITPEIHLAIFGFDCFSTIFFFAEYVGRLWTADLHFPEESPTRARLHYAFSPMGIIDLLSFLPLLAVFGGIISYQTLNAFRIIRVVRLAKLSRYMDGLNAVGNVMRKRRHEIVAAFMVLFLLALTSSVLMYQAESEAQPDKFNSIYAGIYWAVTTITSTGFGDLYPITDTGRFIGLLTMVCSIGCVAIPAGIFTAGFIEEMRDPTPFQSTLRRGAPVIRITEDGLALEDTFVSAEDVANNTDLHDASSANSYDTPERVVSTGSKSISPVQNDAKNVSADGSCAPFRYCPNCGEELPIINKPYAFCPLCGGKLPVEH